jgi:flagellar biosynthesis protein FliP
VLGDSFRTLYRLTQRCCGRLCLLFSILLCLVGVAEAENRLIFPENPEPELVRPIDLPEPQAAAPTPMIRDQIEDALSPTGLSPTLRIMILLTALSLAPSILLMTTSFVRFVIVFGLLRQALGTQQLPPTQVITSLSIFLTMFTMMPVWQEAYDQGIAPYVNQEPIPNLQPGEDPDDPLKRVFLNTFQPIKRFMSEQIAKSGGDEIVMMLIDFRRPNPNSEAGRLWKEPENFEDVDPAIIVTAYMLSELKIAFIIGFQVFLPFLIIDMVVATVLTSMGMMMLSPMLISLPFKILLFVLVDGWMLITQMLLQSVDATFL